MRAFPLVSLACAIAGVPSFGRSSRGGCQGDTDRNHGDPVQGSYPRRPRRGLTKVACLSSAAPSTVWSSGCVSRARTFNPACEPRTSRSSRAVDDTGQKLKNPAEANGMADSSTWGGDMSWSEWSGSEVTSSPGKAARKSIDVQVRLTSPSRKATKLARVRGEFEVKTGGSGKSVTLQGSAIVVGQNAQRLSVERRQDRGHAGGSQAGEGQRRQGREQRLDAEGQRQSEAAERQVSRWWTARART